MRTNLGGVGGCGALIVVQAARTPTSMQEGKTMFTSGMLEAVEFTITGTSTDPVLRMAFVLSEVIILPREFTNHGNTSMQFSQKTDYGNV